MVAKALTILDASLDNLGAFDGQLVELTQIGDGK